MSTYIAKETIRALRESKGLTQSQLARFVGVTDKAVSKWETGRGLPDISLIEPLAQALGVSVAELLTGDIVRNANRGSNMLRTAFYVCPICGNVVHAVGEGSFSCCGSQLLPQTGEEPDEDHAIQVERIDGELYVHLDHPMTKRHYVSFVAYLTSDVLQFRKLYPEQEAEARFTPRGHGAILAFCNRHGLYKARV